MECILAYSPCFAGFFLLLFPFPWLFVIVYFLCIARKKMLDSNIVWYDECIILKRAFLIFFWGRAMWGRACGREIRDKFKWHGVNVILSLITNTCKDLFIFILLLFYFDSSNKLCAGPNLQSFIVSKKRKLEKIDSSHCGFAMFSRWGKFFDQVLLRRLTRKIMLWHP